MGTIYPVTSLQLTAVHINHPDGPRKWSGRIYYQFTSELSEALEPILAPYGYPEADSEFPGVPYFTGRLGDLMTIDVERPPWAIVLYRREYDLAGHLLSIRAKPEDIRLSAYSVLHPRYESLAALGRDTPPLSVLWVASKEALRLAADTGSLLVQDAWQSLAKCSDDRHWVCLCDPLESGWVASHEAVDRELFLRLMPPG